MEKLAADYATCDALLKRDDRDRWLASLFLPARLRPHIHALYAFSLEIARVRQLVSEPMLGEIRFQWWREVLAGEGGEANPVAAALLDTIARFALPREPLIGLIDARLFDLYDAPMPSIAALETYAKATAASLFQLAASILGAGEESIAAAEHAGIAYAVMGLLRALPWHLAAGQVYIPLDVLAAQGLDGLRTGRDKAALLHALAEIRALARRHLMEFAGAARAGNAAPAFLPLALCEPYLGQMENPGYDPFTSRIALPDWRRLWLLWRAARRIG
ncbi:MAG TPA: phytoene/squalene synthase family protein [Methylovirgula sp.]|nr:phytoene/squalene synthase family protein [Methylovirgula sp.]